MTAALADATGPAPEPPAGLRERVRSDPGLLVLPVATLLILAQLVLRGWAAAGGYFLLDDFVFVYRAVELPFDGRIFEDYNGHLMPGSFLLVELLTALVPLSWSAVVGLGLIQQLAIDVVLFQVLVRLFGKRPAVLLPFAVYLTSSITLPAFLWWAAALNQLPMQLAVLLALRAHLRYLHSGRTADALRATGAVAVGLAFSEKTVLALPLLAAVSLFWFGEGGVAARLRSTASTHRTGWLLLGGLGGAYTVFYLLHVPSPILAAPSPADIAVLTGQALVRSVLPGLLGGPWTWEDFPPTLAITDPPAVLQWLSVAVVAAVLAVSVLRRRGAGRAWVLLGLYVAGSCLLLAASRVQVIGPYALAREYRYFTDVAMVGALCLAFAYLPVRDAPVVLRPRATWLDRPARRLAAVPFLGPALGAAVVVALFAGSVVSTIGYAQRWHANPARTYIENARAGLADRPGTLLVDSLAPDRVQWNLLGQYALASRLLTAAPEVSFLRDGQSTGALTMLDDQGQPQPAFVQTLVSGVPGPTPECGWLVADRPVPIPLQNGGVGAWGWIVRVVWLSAVDNTGWIRAGEQRVPVLLPAGLHETFVQVSGAVDAVTVELADPTRPVCIPQVEVGSAAILPPAFR